MVVSTHDDSNIGRILMWITIWEAQPNSTLLLDQSYISQSLAVKSDSPCWCFDNTDLEFQFYAVGLLSSSFWPVYQLISPIQSLGFLLTYYLSLTWCTDRDVNSFVTKGTWSVFVQMSNILQWVEYCTLKRSVCVLTLNICKYDHRWKGISHFLTNY